MSLKFSLLPDQQPARILPESAIQSFLALHLCGKSAFRQGSVFTLWYRVVDEDKAVSREIGPISHGEDKNFGRRSGLCSLRLNHLTSRLII